VVNAGAIHHVIDTVNEILHTRPPIPVLDLLQPLLICLTRFGIALSERLEEWPKVDGEAEFDSQVSDFLRLRNRCH
jgi:hypothetical protein